MLGLQFRRARRFSTGCLKQGDAKEDSHDPPLVVVNETHHGANLVLEGLAAVPQDREAQNNARHDERYEFLGRHAKVSDKEAHNV